jgi:hypothetical protein
VLPVLALGGDDGGAVAGLFEDPSAAEGPQTCASSLG